MKNILLTNLIFVSRFCKKRTLTPLTFFRIINRRADHPGSKILPAFTCQTAICQHVLRTLNNGIICRKPGDQITSHTFEKFNEENRNLERPLVNIFMRYTFEKLSRTVFLNYSSRNRRVTNNVIVQYFLMGMAFFRTPNTMNNKLPNIIVISVPCIYPQLAGVFYPKLGKV